MQLQYFKNITAAKNAAKQLPLERLETLYEQMEEGPERRCLVRKMQDIRAVQSH